MAMMQQLGDGFAIGKAWQMVKRNWTGLLCAAVVPSLVAGLCHRRHCTRRLLLGMGAIAPMALIDPYSFGGGAAAGMLGALGLLGVLVMLVVMVICLVIEFFASLVTVRAVAHWVGRYAPEWASEATYRASSYGASVLVLSTQFGFRLGLPAAPTFVTRTRLPTPRFEPFCGFDEIGRRFRLMKPDLG